MNLLTLCVTLACLLLLSSMNAQRMGEEAPDFALVDREGVLVRLSDFRGTPVIVNFWATWCLPCREELPLFQRISDEVNQELDTPKLVFLLVNNNEAPAAARRFLVEMGITLNGVFDATGEERAQLSMVPDASADVLRRYRVRGMPTSFFIDSHGIIQRVKLGELSPSEASQFLASLGVSWQAGTSPVLAEPGAP